MTLITANEQSGSSDDFPSVLKELCNYKEYFEDKNKSADLVDWVQDELNCSKVAARFLVRKVTPFVLAKLTAAASSMGQSWRYKLHDKLSKYTQYRNLTSSLLDILKTRTDKSYAKTLDIPSEEHLQILIDSPQRWSNLNDTQKAMMRLMVGQQAAKGKLELIVESLANIESLFAFNLDLETVEDIQTKASGAELGTALWLTYTSQQCPLIGRGEELKTLVSFYNCESIFSWYVITGRGGLGKSRLALDSIQTTFSWNAGFLSNEKLTVEDALSQWAPVEPTLIVIDYAAKNIERIVSWLLHLHKHQDGYDFPVRVLLIEREYKDQLWWEQLTLGSSDKLSLQKDFYGYPKVFPMELKSLSLDNQQLALRGFLNNLKAISRLPDPNDSIWNTINQLSIEGNPLFIGMIAAVLTTKSYADIRHWQYKDVLENMLVREKIHWQQQLHEFDVTQQKQIINLYVLSSFMGGVNFYQNDEFINALLLVTSISNKAMLFSYWNVIKTLSGNQQGKLQPDLFAEYFSLMHWKIANDGEEAAFEHVDMLNLAFKYAQSDSSDFIMRCVTDYPISPASFHWWRLLLGLQPKSTLAPAVELGFKIVNKLDLKGQYDIALDRWLLNGLNKDSGSSKLARAKNKIGTFYFKKGDYQSGLPYLTESLVICQEKGDKTGESEAMNTISKHYKVQGDYEIALEYLNDSLTIRQELNDKLNEGLILNDISKIYQELKNYQTALKYVKDSLNIMRQIKNKVGESVTLNAIALIYQSQEDFKVALMYLMDALNIFKEIGDKENGASLLSNIASIHKSLGELNYSLNFYKWSLNIRKEIGDKAGEGLTLNNISSIYQERHDYDTALTYLNDSLKIRQEIGDKAGECATLFNIGHIYWSNNQHTKAMNSWKNVYKIATEINYHKAQEHLIDLAKQLGLKGGLAGWQKL